MAYDVISFSLFWQQTACQTENWQIEIRTTPPPHLPNYLSVLTASIPGSMEMGPIL